MQKKIKRRMSITIEELPKVKDANLATLDSY